MSTKHAAFFHALYEQTEPVGAFGRGVHYSVYRALVWHNPDLSSRKHAAFHDIAVVWDEDHDTRVLGVLARIHADGALAAINFIGEAKGMLSVVLDEHASAAFDDDAMEQFAERLRPLADIGSDTWPVEVARRSDNSTIAASVEEATDIYLNSIDLLWKLGNKKVEVPSPDEE
jgi:hypothetical protein